VNFEMHLEAMIDLGICRRSISRPQIRRMAQLERRLNSFVNFKLCECRELGTARSDVRSGTGWEWETVVLGMIQYSVYAVLGVCSTWCMLYSVLTHDGGMHR
jgi:hypothetical protein